MIGVTAPEDIFRLERVAAQIYRRMKKAKREGGVM
jgi:hypothetical protein